MEIKVLDEIKNKLSVDIQSAFDVLEKNIEEDPMINDFILLKGRYNKLELDFMRNIISYPIYEVNLSKIRFDFLNCLKLINAKKIYNPDENVNEIDWTKILTPFLVRFGLKINIFDQDENGITFSNQFIRNLTEISKERLNSKSRKFEIQNKDTSEIITWSILKQLELNKEISGPYNLEELGAFMEAFSLPISQFMLNIGVKSRAIKKINDIYNVQPTFDHVWELLTFYYDEAIEIGIENFILSNNLEIINSGS